MWDHPEKSGEKEPPHVGLTFAYPPVVASTRAFALLFLSTVFLTATGCSSEEEPNEEAESSEATVNVASQVVIADTRATQVADVQPSKILIPIDAAEKYRALAPGTIFVGARGNETSKNPDGFLRRIQTVGIEGSNVAFTTTPATLLDAIVDGTLRTSSGSVSLEGDALTGGRALGTIDLDFSNQPLVDNVDTITTAAGETKFYESIQIDKGLLKFKPNIDVDLRIKEGKVSRFLAKVEGNMDSSIGATARVTAEGAVNEETLTALKAKRQQVKKTIYQSKRVPLPTFSVGRIPISPSVQFTVSLTCDIGFGGPMKATTGVEAKSYVRLAGVFEHGDWAPPTKSEFDIRPSFDLEHGGAVDARCAIEADAELSAYGVGGVTMTVAPYLDFEIERGPLGGSAEKVAPPYLWTVQAGATGAMKATSDVFGVRDLNRPLVEWKAPQPITGTR
jgi:hypothetical protein